MRAFGFFLNITRPSNHTVSSVNFSSA